MKTESSDSQISQTRILFTIEHKKKPNQMFKQTYFTVSWK